MCFNFMLYICIYVFIIYYVCLLRCKGALCISHVCLCLCVCECVRVCVCVCVCVWSDNNIGDDGAQAIANALVNNKTLTIIGLSSE